MYVLVQLENRQQQQAKKMPLEQNQKINVDNNLNQLKKQEEDSDPSRPIRADNEKQKRVKEMFLHAFKGYQKFAFGFDEGIIKEPNLFLFILLIFMIVSYSSCFILSLFYIIRVF
jgi:hypothetical protein